MLRVVPILKDTAEDIGYVRIHPLTLVTRASFARLAFVSPTAAGQGLQLLALLRKCLLVLACVCLCVMLCERAAK